MTFYLYFFVEIRYNYYGDDMKKNKIDLSDIKEEELDKTSSFTDLMSRRERKNYLKEKENIDSIEKIINEKKNDVKEILKEEKEKTKKVKNSEKAKDNDTILELTRSMKFNFDEVKEENNNTKKKVFSKLNIIGEINLLCIGYYIYLLTFTNYQDVKDNYILNGGLIVLLVLLFGMSVVTNKKIRKVFMFINLITIIAFIAFNAFTILN